MVQRSTLTPTVVVSLALLGLLAAPITAAAGATGTIQGANETANGSHSYVAQVDPATKIIDFRHEGGADGRMLVTIKTETYKEVVLTDRLAGIGERGATTISTETYGLGPGVHTISLSVETFRGGAGVTVATSGGVVGLSTGVRGQNPLGGQGSTVGYLGGAGIAAASGILAGLYVLRKEDDTPRRAG